jgi:hypothetical protein
LTSTVYLALHLYDVASLVPLESFIDGRIDRVDIRGGGSHHLFGSDRQWSFGCNASLENPGGLLFVQLVGTDSVENLLKVLDEV